MQKLYFTGTIEPKSVHIRHYSAVWTAFGLPTDRDFCKYQIAIKDHMVSVTCEVNEFIESDLSTLANRAIDLVRLVIDLYVFASGVGIRVNLDTFIAPDLSRNVLAPTYPNLAGLATAFTPSSVASMYHLIVGDEATRKVLSDLSESLTTRHAAAINCARAVEGIRTILAPSPPTSRKVAWEQMCRKLNIHKDYLSYITDVSIAPRHGDRNYIEGAVIHETLRRTWIIVNRFLELKKRKAEDLPADEFCLLNVPEVPHCE